jgi:hypothetical protein
MGLHGCATPGDLKLSVLLLSDGCWWRVKVCVSAKVRLKVKVSKLGVGVVV